MGILSKQKEEKKIFLVFDIGSSSVGGALFEIQKSGKPKIVFSVREPIKIENKIETERFLSSTVKSLEVIASKISKLGFGKPAKIFCVLSSSWYASSTRIIKLEKNTPFIFTTKLATELLKKEITLFEEKYVNKFLNTKNKIRIIEFKNIKTMLNGYATSNPFDKKTRKVEMTVFVSMSEEQNLKKIEETIAKHFNFRTIMFSSFALSSFTIVRDMFMKQENFLLVDISGEITDISMVKKDILTDSISFPLGYHFIIRKLANVLNCSLDEAKSFISLYKDSHALKSTENKLEPIIDKIKNEWLSNFQESLANLSTDISIPSNIFLTVEQDFEDFFIDIIKSEQYNQHTLTQSKFRIILLNTKTLHGVVSFDKDIARDPFIIIESVYLNRFIC